MTTTPTTVPAKAKPVASAYGFPVAADWHGSFVPPLPRDVLAHKALAVLERLDAHETQAYELPAVIARSPYILRSIMGALDAGRTDSSGVVDDLRALRTVVAHTLETDARRGVFRLYETIRILERLVVAHDMSEFAALRRRRRA